MFGVNVSYSASFAAGMASFFSPCILPRIPAYCTFITGYSLDELTGDDTRKIRYKVFTSTLSFVLGFSLVFILLGATASFLGALIYQHQNILRIGGGVVIIILGLHLSGLFRIKYLDVEKRLHLKSKPVHFLGAFIVGMAFAAGWSPCVGPFLGSILTLAAGQDTVSRGIILLAIYSLGLAIPFLVISLFVHLVLRLVRRGVKVMRYINAGAGILLVVVGVLLLTNQINFIN
jgi:cytochrome c-type biogenesis protein